MNLSAMRKVLLSSAFLLAVTGCNKSSNKGPGISLPEIEPSVRENLPTSLKSSTTLALNDCGTSPTAGTDSTETFTDYFSCSVIAEVKSRFFAKGPTQLVGDDSLLAKADENLAMIEAAADGKEVPCLDGTPVKLDSKWDYTSATGASKSIDFDFPTYLNCRFDMESDGRKVYRAFGRKSKTYYMREGNFKTANMTYKVTDSNVAELWMQIGAPTLDDTSTGVVHLYSNPTTDITEITHTGVGLGYGCGVQLRMNHDLIYVAVKVLKGGNNESDCAANYAAATNSATDGMFKDQSFCLAASDFSAQPVSDCTDAKLNAFALDGLSYETIDVEDVGKIMKDARPTKVPVFDPKDVE